MRPTEWDSPGARMLRVLEAATEAARPLSIRELAMFAELPRSTTHRLAGELVEHGMLERVAGGLQPGMRLFELGQRVPRHRLLRDVALPAMHDLHAATGQLVQLAVLDGGETVCLEQIAARSGPPVPSQPGRRMPAHATAMGKALLADAEPTLIDALLSHPLPALTEATITDPDALRAELRRIRRRGHATSHEESQRGLFAIAAPLRDATRTVASLAVGVRRRTAVRDALPALLVATSAIGRELVSRTRSPPAARRTGRPRPARES
jgi:IclR family transcriptional regulator, acetate operon repressor